jgi:hypothetical protein
MKWNAYFLIFLTSWAQLDDALLLALPPACQSAALPGEDDDEGIPPECKEQQEALSARRQPQPVGVDPRTADSPSARRDAPSELDLISPFIRPPLYVLMSLQI